MVAPWRYDYDLENLGDNRKRAHYAIAPDGRRVEIDHTPYETITPDAFAAHVALGFPERPHRKEASGCVVGFPWRNGTILAEQRRADLKAHLFDVVRTFERQAEVA